MKDEAHPTLPHQVDRIVTEVKTQKISDEKLLTDYAIPTAFYVDENEDTELPKLIGIDKPYTFKNLIDGSMAKVRKDKERGLQGYSKDMDNTMRYAARTGDTAVAFEIMDIIGADDKNTFVSPEILVEVWEACRNHAYKLRNTGDQEQAVRVLHRGIDLWQNQLEKLPLGSRLGRMLNRVANAQIV